MDRAPVDAVRRALLLASALAPLLPSFAQGRLPRMGYLGDPVSPPRLGPLMAPFGWEVGRNLLLEVQTVERIAPAAHYEQAARRVVAARPDVVMTFGAEGVRPLVRAAPTLPIVATLWDPVREGFAESLARPGRSVTGLSYEAPRVYMLMLETMRTLVPGFRRLHSLAAPEFHGDPLFALVREEARSEHQVEVVMHDVRSEAEALDALASVGDRRQEAVFLRPVGFDRAEVVRRALRLGIPITSPDAASGALFTLSPQHGDPLRALATLVDKVLRGASPATLPFERPTRIRLELNRSSARHLGITIPDELLLRATALHG